MLGYLISPCRGARIYNAFHTYTLPVVLGLSAWLLHAHGLVPFALIWINHIGVDRAAGLRPEILQRLRVDAPGHQGKEAKSRGPDH